MRGCGIRKGIWALAFGAALLVACLCPSRLLIFIAAATLIVIGIGSIK